MPSAWRPTSRQVRMPSPKSWKLSASHSMCIVAPCRISTPQVTLRTSGLITQTQRVDWETIHPLNKVDKCQTSAIQTRQTPFSHHVWTDLPVAPVLPQQRANLDTLSPTNMEVQGSVHFHVSREGTPSSRTAPPNQSSPVPAPSAVPLAVACRASRKPRAANPSSGTRTRRRAVISTGQLCCVREIHLFV